MKWATMKGLGLNRPPCFWLIRRFIDPEAEFFLFDEHVALEEARKIGAKTFHVHGGDYLIGDGKTTLEKIMAAYDLFGKDPALDLFAKVFNDVVFKAKVNEATFRESYGIRALDRGLRSAAPDDHERERLTSAMYESLYQWCLQETGTAPTTP